MSATAAGSGPTGDTGCISGRATSSSSGGFPGCAWPPRRSRIKSRTLMMSLKRPRASAVAYLCAGLEAGAAPDDVLAAAEAAGAPFVTFDDYRAWVKTALLELRKSREKSG